MQTHEQVVESKVGKATVLQVGLLQTHEHVDACQVGVATGHVCVVQGRMDPVAWNTYLEIEVSAGI